VGVSQTGLVEARRSFDRVPEVYERVRPHYPAGLFDRLFELLPPDPLVLEVGPGTGKATRGLLEHGATVHAVEIGSALAETLRTGLPFEKLSIEVGDFEQMPTTSAAYDCVFAASAYHWIASDARLDRPAVLLKRGGVLAVVDLIQVDSPDDRGFFAAAQHIYARHGQGHTGPPAPHRDEVAPPLLAELRADPRFADVQMFPYDWDQTYTASTYRLLMESYSVTQMMSPESRTALLGDMEVFVRDQFHDEVVRPLVATLTVASRRATT
jgi:SAM-dependent methyltransferase